VASPFTIVIPHRRDPSRLERLLAALRDPVLVVDDSDEGCRLDVPAVRLGGGSGFAVACNAGLERVTTPFAVLLNDDARPEGDCLERLAGHLGNRPVGPILHGPAGIESAGIRVRGWGRVRAVTSTCPDAPMIEVDAVSGACMGIPTTARFDPRFPHGFEDVDLCIRLGGALLIPSARCWHEGGGTLHRRSPQAQAAAVTGQMLAFAPGWREPLIAALHAGQVLREGASPSRMAAIGRGWRDARRLR
jgi:GT2 family glycosyltransferase